VIDLDDENGQNELNRKEDPLSKRSKKKIDRLTKIKQPVIKNIIVTKNVENVPVDHHFSKFNECHVFEMGGCFYNATLTQSNIVRDDNKFFIIQILQMNHNEGTFISSYRIILRILPLGKSRRYWPNLITGSIE
jgi:hypothetical protein